MPIWLLNFLPLVWGGLKIAFKKFWLPILIVSIIGFGVFTFRHFKNKYFNEGFKSGYAQCTKDNPTYGNVGQVVNVHNGKKTIIALGPLSLDLSTEWFGFKPNKK